MTIAVVFLSVALLWALATRQLKSRRTIMTTWQHINGTYRDPDIYECTVGDPPNERLYRVRHISEIPEPDRSLLDRALRPRYDWMARFFEPKVRTDAEVFTDPPRHPVPPVPRPSSGKTYLS
jgi:hypothetical protein